jgi:hypothetical protein
MTRANVRTKILRASFLSVCLLAISAGFLAAQDSGSGQPAAADMKVPYLNGHVFTTTDQVPDPFISTYLRSNLGMSKAYGLDIPLGVIDGDTIQGLTGDLLFAVLRFEYQQKIQSWIAVRAQAQVIGRLGDGIQSLLATGISANMGFEFGWLFKLLRSERVMLSGSLDISNNSFTTINLLDFIRDIIDTGEGQLVRKTPSLRAGGGLRFGWGVSELFGVTAFAETGYGESVVRGSSDEWFTAFGATADFDLGAKTTVPIGIALGYNQDSFPEGGADIAEVVRGAVVKLAYTGRSDFTIGLNFAYTGVPIRTIDQRIKSASTTFEMRYFF